MEWEGEDYGTADWEKQERDRKGKGVDRGQDQGSLEGSRRNPSGVVLIVSPSIEGPINTQYKRPQGSQTHLCQLRSPSLPFSPIPSSLTNSLPPYKLISHPS